MKLNALDVFHSWAFNWKRFLVLGAVTAATFGLLWWPWLSSMESMLTVVERLFPLRRGLFEDKVANFWCSFNIVYKIRYVLRIESIKTDQDPLIRYTILNYPLTRQKPFR